jgi:tetratricopeptide (TPR) repeat protein
MKRYIAIVIMLFVTTLASAQEQTVNTEQALPADLNAVWSSANSAYNEGDFAQAVQLYESILTAGEHSAKVYYNLGNAYFKQEALGKAILNYRRALRLAPYDEDILHNLEYATAATKDQIESIPEFFLSRWVAAARNIMGSDGWTIASLVVLALTFMATLLYLLAQVLSKRKAGFYAMCVGVVLFIVTTIFAYQSRQELIGGGEAVIMSSAVAIKSSPDRAATDLFVLHEGTHLSVGESIDGWAEIRIADGRKGWIEISRIEII